MERITKVFIKTYDTRFLEDDVYEGDIPRDDVREDTTPVEAEVPGLIALAFAVAEELRSLGIDYCEGADWFYDIDGSQIIDYGTGERSEMSGHLYLDEACTEAAPPEFFGMVAAVVAYPLWGRRPKYDPSRSRHAEKQWGYRPPIDPDLVLI